MTSRTGRYCLRTRTVKVRRTEREKWKASGIKRERAKSVSYYTAAEEDCVFQDSYSITQWSPSDPPRQNRLTECEKDQQKMVESEREVSKARYEEGNGSPEMCSAEL